MIRHRFPRAFMLVSLLAAPACSDCPSGDSGKKTEPAGAPNAIVGTGARGRDARPMPPFRQVELKGAIDARITIGEPPSVTIETDDNLLGAIQTEVRGGTLEINNTKSYRSGMGVLALITAPGLEGISTIGSGSVIVEAVHTPSLDVTINGSGTVTASGTADRLAVKIAGSGAAYLFGLSARDATVEVNGSGEAVVDPLESLAVTINGSGKVLHRTTPPKIDRKIRGSGELSPAEAR